MDELTISAFSDIVEAEAQNVVQNKGLCNRQGVNDGYCNILTQRVRSVVRRRYGDEYLLWSSDAPRVKKHTYGTTKLVNASHVWLEFRGLHFDAECTDGVENPEQLPIFERNHVQNPIDSVE